MSEQPNLDDRHADPEEEPSIATIQIELDRLYQELLALHGVEPDVALLRLAHMGAWASSVRGRLSRVPCKATWTFMARELDPFVEALGTHAKLLGQAASIRRTNRR